MSLLKKQNKFEESMKAKLSELETKPSDSLWAKLDKELDTDSFEPTLRSKFDDFTIPVTDKTWNLIEAQLPQEKNKKRILAFWFTGIFILASGLGFFVSRFYFSSDELPKQTALKENLEKIPESPTTPPIHQEDQSTTQDESSLNTAVLGYSAKQESFNGNQAASEVVAQSTISEFKPPHQIVQETAAETNKQLNRQSTNSLANRNTKQRVNASNSADESKNLLSSQEMKQPKNSESLTDKPISPAANSNNSNQSITAPASESGGRQLTEAKDLVKLDDVHIKFDKDSIQRSAEANTDNYSSEDDQPGKFSISAIAGIYRTEMLLEKPSSNVYDLNKAFELRSKLESASLDWSGGFLLNYHFNENWMLSSGVQISNFKQALHYDLAIPEADSFHQIQSQNLYLHPTDSIIEGHVKTLDNKYSFTEIPLWITYSVRTDKKVGFDFMLGYSFALLTSVNAYMPDPACVGLLNVNDKASFPKIKGTSFINISPAVNYRINPTVQLGLMPQVKLGLSSVIDNANWIQEKPWAIGLNFYLRKRF